MIPLFVVVLRLLPTLLVSEILLPSLTEALSSSDTASRSFHHAKLASAEDLQDLMQSPSVSYVYFSGHDTPEIQTFLQQYDKAAKYLKIYNVTLAVYDCTSNMADHDYCKKEGADNQVYVFQNGTVLLNLTLEILHDVNSIMTNFLHLILLHQVPIIKTELELQDLQRNALGRRDILLAYPEHFGNEDHQIFLEVAYTFHDRLQFALATDVKVMESTRKNVQQEIQSGLSLWVLFCAESSSEGADAGVICQSTEYLDDISFSALAQFIKRFLERNVYHVPADGVSQVFDLPDKLPIIFLYASKDEHEQDQMSSVTKFIKFNLRGYVKLVLVDMDDEECRDQAKQQGFAGKLPAAGIKQYGAVTFMNQSDNWSLKNVQEFIMDTISDNIPPGFEISESDDQGTDDEYLQKSDNVQSQDDQIAEAVYALRAEDMELDHVPPFLKHDFYKIVPQADLKFVLFYLPFDQISMAFLREFGSGAEILAKNFSDTSVMARVNCYDATDLCTAENITTYPVLRMYRKGQNYITYKGSLDIKSVIRAVKLWQLNSPVYLASEQEVESYIKGEHPKSFYKFTPSSVLLLASTENSDVENVFLNVSKNWSIITAFAVVHGDLAQSVAKMYGVSVPSVVAFHHNDQNKPVRVFSEQLSETSLTNFVKNSLIITVPKLTSINLPTLFARKLPFVILFVDSSDPESAVAKETLTQLAMTGQFDNVTFCWMDAQANTMGEVILLEYTWSATLPMLTLVDHRKGELFNYQPEILGLEDTTDWLSRVLANKIRPSKLLQYAKWGPPGQHYDFLAKMDKIKEAKPDYTSLPEETMEVSPQSKSVSEMDEKTSETNSDTVSETEDNFQQLQNSRVYPDSLEQHDEQMKLYLMKKESDVSDSNHHTEL